MNYLKKLINYLVVVSLFFHCSGANNVSEVFRSITSFRDCISSKHPMVCVKEKALDALNETIFSDKPMDFNGMLQIERNPQFPINLTEEDNLPDEATERSLKLSNILYDKIEEFFRSRTVKLNLGSAFEGRKKGDGGGKKGGNMMMLGMVGMACMVAQLMLGKVAFIAGTALVVAKVALFLSAIIGIKKLSSGSSGGGETQHVVYASSGGDYGKGHGGGGGGGWHRSIDDAQNLAYKAQILENNIGY